MTHEQKVARAMPEKESWRGRFFLAMLMMWGVGIAAYAEIQAPAAAPQLKPKMEAEVDPDWGEYVRMATATTQAWDAGDFVKLEALSAKYRDLSVRDVGGKTMAANFGVQFEASIRYPGPKSDAKSDKSGCECAPSPGDYPRINAQWAKVGAKIDKWIALYPKSSTAHIAQAIYFSNKAGFFRGSGYVDKVPPQAWPIFGENLRLAGEALEKSYAISKKNPLWYPVMFRWMSIGNASYEARIQVVAAMGAQKMSYAEPFIVAMYFMEPQWGGSFERIDQMARIADSETKNVDFGSLYARVYWGLATGYDLSLRDNFFQKTKADWPKMKKSFDAMVEHFPSSRNYSGYAFFACQAGDPLLARSLLIKAQSVEYFESESRKQWPICEPEQWRRK